jgi:glycosyltransferase involved in cell wall biosynthesis
MRASAGKRILMLLQNNPYPRDTRVRREALALVAAGHEVTVISPRAPDQSAVEVVDGVHAYRYPAPPEADGFAGYVLEYGTAVVASAVLTLWVLLRRGFDVIHAHNPPDLFVLVAAPYKLFGKRFVFDHHDLAPEMYDARFRERARPAVRTLLRWAERLTFRLADHVISTNESYREVALQRGGVSPERVTVVRNGPILERWVSAEPDPAWRAKAPTLIGYIGQMAMHDGIDYLLRALHELVTTLGRDDVHLVLIGEGSDKPRLEALRDELGLAPYVTFTGHVSDDEVVRILASSDVCVSPDPKDPFTERSTMIKLTEYMALSKPMVAFDLLEHRRTAGDAALYARPNDVLDFARQIERLMDDPALRQALGREGRRRMEEGLSWEHSRPALLGVYESLPVAGAARESEALGS